MTEPYDNTNSGVLFPNEQKTKPNQPALRGEMDLDSIKYWASAWRKVNAEKVPYLSIALQQKMEKGSTVEVETFSAELHPIASPKSDKAPTFEGIIHMEDEEIPIVAWVKQSTAKGTTFFAIRVDTPSEGSGGNGDAIDTGDVFFGLGSAQDVPVPQEPAPEMDFDEEIPF